MARAFEQTTGRLCDRLVTALAAGQAAGGVSRGQQSAALLIVRELQTILTATGDYQGAINGSYDDVTRDAFASLAVAKTWKDAGLKMPI